MKLSESFLFVFLFLGTPALFAQTAEVSNDQPLWGEQVEIIYTPDSAGSFTMEDEIYVRPFIYLEDYSTQADMIQMKRRDTNFVASLTIQKGTAAVSLSFNTAEAYDRRTSALIRPISKKGDHYRNAFASNLFDAPEEYKKELINFPQNYVVYRHRWQVLPYSQKDSAEIIIRDEMSRLSKKGVKNQSYHYVLLTGHAQLGEFEEARSHFETLINRFPESPLILEAFSYYSYQRFSHSHGDHDLLSVVRSFMMEHPKHRISKKQLRLLVSKSDQPGMKQAIHTITSYWMKQEPDNADLFMYHALTLENPDSQLVYLNQAANILFDATHSVKQDYTWKQDLPNKVYELAKGLYSAGAYAQALGLLELYERNAVQKESYVYMLKGQILQALHNPRSSITAYVKAADMGSEEGLDSARVQFAHLAHSDSFESYLLALRKELFENEVVFDAPGFEIEDLEGNALNLEELKGKVVVLNFWFIGCAPCRIEMPGLNEMVKHYEGKEVEFLAFALDNTDNLNEFLANNEFAYRVIPASFEVANQYGVSGYPTHVIIDKEGKIRSTLMGGSPERHLDIQPMIDRILAF
ncbi:MAG: TlpA disulfide reductase family protein [Bacteroidota bacterium]